MESLKFAIIGCGRIAHRHAEHIQRFAQLKAVCDIKEERAREFAEKYSCRWYPYLETLLKEEKDIEVVSVCTPNNLHAEQTILSLRQEKHVVCEKPMALTVRDCQTMIEEARRAEKKLFIVKQNRFNPPIAALKQILDEGRLGAIVNVQLNCFWNRDDRYYFESDWKGKKALDGGTLFTQFSHFIDLLLWLVGDIKNLFPLTKNLLHTNSIEFEDTGVIALEFSSGALGTINYTVNSFKKNMEGSITLFGEHGTVKVGGQYLNVLEYQCIDNFEMTNIPASSPANDYGFYQGSMSNHDKVYQNVIDVLQSNHPIATTGEEGLKTVEVIERIYNFTANKKVL